MYRIRVKNLKNRKRHIKSLDKDLWTLEEAKKVFSYTVDDFQGLETIVTLYNEQTREILEEQDCRFLG
jgi:protease II